MNHTAHGLRARRSSWERALCQTGVAARDRWCGLVKERCNGVGDLRGRWSDTGGRLRIYGMREGAFAIVGCGQPAATLREEGRGALRHAGVQSE